MPSRPLPILLRKSSTRCVARPRSSPGRHRFLLRQQYRPHRRARCRCRFPKPLRLHYRRRARQRSQRLPMLQRRICSRQSQHGGKAISSARSNSAREGLPSSPTTPGCCCGAASPGFTSECLALPPKTLVMRRRSPMTIPGHSCGMGSRPSSGAGLSRPLAPIPKQFVATARICWPISIAVSPISTPVKRRRQSGISTTPSATIHGMCVPGFTAVWRPPGSGGLPTRCVPTRQRCRSIRATSRRGATSRRFVAAPRGRRRPHRGYGSAHTRSVPSSIRQVSPSGVRIAVRSSSREADRTSARAISRGAMPRAAREAASR